MSCTELLACVACSNDKIEKFLDLHDQPLANNFTDTPIKTDEYPLAVNYCDICGHTQLSHSVDPSVLFANYIYKSGTSNTLKDYFLDFAKKVSNENTSSKTVLDIACNDGSQLNAFSNYGWKTYGVDPAENLLEESSKVHNITHGFWPCDTHLKKYDVIVAQNVLAHTPNPYEFLLACSDNITNTGKIYIQTSQSQMYQRGEFDTFYHEHISFFSVSSMLRLAGRCGLYLNKVEIMDIHGDSYLFTLSKEYNVQNSIAMKEKEDADGRTTFSFYEKFADNVKTLCDEFKHTVEKYKQDGYTVIGYGAAAKGMTFLNAAQTELDFIIDDSPAKQGLFSPAMQIPVVSIDELSKHDKVIIVPLAWNFLNEIRQRVDAVKSDVKYITYFPSVTTID